MVLQMFSTGPDVKSTSEGFLRIMRDGKVLADPCFREYMVPLSFDGEWLQPGTQQHAEYLAIVLARGTYTSAEVSRDPWDEPYTILR